MLLVSAVGVQISRSADALLEGWKTCRSRVCVLINKRSFEPAMCLDLEGLALKMAGGLYLLRKSTRKYFTVWKNDS